MKAIVIQRYGPPDVLEVVELPTPTPKAGEVLIENKAISINPYDCMARNGEVKMLEGFRFPKILGGECAGEVVETGVGVKHFRKGDRVIAFTGRGGAYREFVTIPAAKCVALPEGVSFAEGASLPIAGTTAYDALHRLGKMKSSQNVLIYGAYGSVGSFAVQIAKLAGAKVTAVCSTSSVEKVKALGADVVVDYTRENFLDSSVRFDIVFDTPHVLPFGKTKKVLNESGILIGTMPSPMSMLTQMSTLFSKQKYKVIFADPTPEKIALLAGLVKEGKLKVIIDREYGFDELPQAHRYSETKRAKGKIIIRVAD